MRKNHIIKKVAKFLDLGFEKVSPNFKFLNINAHNISVVTTEDIDTVAKSLICRTWHNKNKSPLWDEIIWSSEFTVSGVDIQNPKKKIFTKSFFLIDKPLIIIKRTSVRLKYPMINDNYTVIVYKPGKKKLPLQSSFFDLKREYSFHIKWWDKQDNMTGQSS